MLEHKSTREVYTRLLGYLRPYKVRFGWSLGAMVVYGLTDGAIPFLLKRILDDVFGSHNAQMLWLLLVVIVAFSILRGLVGFLQRYLVATVGLGIVRDIRNSICHKLLQLSPIFFDRNSSGSLLSRVTNDTLLVRTALTEAAAAILRDSIRVVVLLVAAFCLDPLLAVISFIGLPLGLYPVYRFGKKIRRLSKMGQEHFGGLTSLLQETIIGHRVVQSFGREKYEQQRFEVENERFTDAFRRAEKYGALSGPTNEIIGSFAIAAVICYGGLSVLSGVRTQGDFIAFITALFLLYEPVKKLSRVHAHVQTGVAAAERIFEVLDTEVEIKDRDGAQELKVDRPAIEYQNVWFSYDDEKTDSKGETVWALRDISIKIKPSQTFALVGMSGGGKSTLVNLLPRYYDVSDGAIRIDGLDIRDATLSSLRSSISVVGQHTFLFNDTVYNNIAYGGSKNDEESVYQAAKAANAHDFISSLPQGYETIVGEQGMLLSGGQRARLAIARALLKNAPILILDEATASLDSESEGLVQEAIDHLMRGRTVLVIAHRLATIQRADAIAVIINGRLEELGTHSELLARSGGYAKLYNMQRRREENERTETFDYQSPADFPKRSVHGE